MSFRTLVIQSKSKLSYKNDYLLIRKKDGIKSVHVSEIGTLIIDSTLVSLTAHLLCELVKNKIKVVLCDEKHNPYGEIQAYYGNHNSSKSLIDQAKWDYVTKGKIWKIIIRQKIINQSWLLNKVKNDKYHQLLEYASEVELDDKTNREGHAAKVYFNSLFGHGFSRGMNNDINAALNYGYAIIMSTVNKEISANGYATQLGIKHKNEYNPFNLTSDIMEPFRIVIDDFVYFNGDRRFDSNYKMDLVNILNKRFVFYGKKYYLTDIIKQYVRSILESLSENDIKKAKVFSLYEGENNENDSVL